MVDLPSSREITPSRPTLSIASAIICPVSGSLPAEIEATCVIDFVSSTGLEYSAI